MEKCKEGRIEAFLDSHPSDEIGAHGTSIMIEKHHNSDELFVASPRFLQEQVSRLQHSSPTFSRCNGSQRGNWLSHS